MKTFLGMSVGLVLATSLAWAQKTAVTDIPNDQSTTIKITKGESSERDYDILTSNAEITGDSNVLLKGAKDSWKKACTEWKNEIKDLNKDNHVLALNCNSPKCTTEQNGTTCVSTGTYQIKVKIKK
jgi:hypothetical protein